MSSGQAAHIPILRLRQMFVPEKLGSAW